MSEQQNPARWVRDGMVAVIVSENERCWAENYTAEAAGVNLTALMLHPGIAQALVAEQEERKAIVEAWDADGEDWDLRDAREAALRARTTEVIRACVERDWPGMSPRLVLSHLRVEWVPVGARFRVRSAYRMGEMVEVLDLADWLTA